MTIKNISKTIEIHNNLVNSMIQAVHDNIHEYLINVDIQKLDYTKDNDYIKCLINDEFAFEIFLEENSKTLDFMVWGSIKGCEIYDARDWEQEQRCDYNKILKLHERIMYIVNSLKATESPKIGYNYTWVKEVV